MNTSQLLDLWRDAASILIAVAGPVVATAVVIGLITSVLQAATQLNDSALSFVPKLAGLIVVLGLGGTWLLGQLSNHMSRSFSHLVEIGQEHTR